MEKQCRNCKKIISADMEACPFCGSSDFVDTNANETILLSNNGNLYGQTVTLNSSASDAQQPIADAQQPTEGTQQPIADTQAKPLEAGGSYPQPAEQSAPFQPQAVYTFPINCTYLRPGVQPPAPGQTVSRKDFINNYAPLSFKKNIMATAISQ